MKRLLFCFVLLLLLSSCKKDWRCECKYTNDNGTSLIQYMVVDKTKKEAEEECMTDLLESTSTLGDDASCQFDPQGF